MDDIRKHAYNDVMVKIPVLPGVWWIDIPQADLRVLCGAPMDITKHLMQLGLVRKIESGGVVYETGPNAILLSDVAVQRGRFWNLAEFPFLHMLYRQGQAIPGHPGNTGRKPLIMGLPERCAGTLRYMYRGTYGLASREEMKDSGVPPADLDDLWRLKLKFAGGSVKPPSELMDVLEFTDDEVIPAEGVRLRRDGENLYSFEYGSEILHVDMNLPEGKDWTASYSLKPMDINDGYFSVTHIGEGNGWDPNRPCMGSLVSYRGRRYLIDVGPGIDYSLESLGIDVSEVTGLVFTHAHDDHFAGLTTLMRGGRRMAVFATRPVMATVRFKCAAILERDPDFIDGLIDVHYLNEDTWNDIDGLEVRPTTSPHPLETTIMFFRALWEGGYRSYAHLADIISMSVFQKFVGGDGVSPEFFRRIQSEYARAADVKKIDAGRGMIHGSAEDFADDPSPRLILSHTEGDLSDAEKELGASVDFGHVDVLIPDRGDRLREQAALLLDRSVPGMAREDHGLLLNGNVERIAPGTPVLKKGTTPESLHLIIGGTVERIGPVDGHTVRFAAGSILGEWEFLSGEPAIGAYRSRGYVKAMRVPADLYVHALSRVKRMEQRIEILRMREHLAAGPFPGYAVSCPRLDDLAEAVVVKTWKKGKTVRAGKDELYILLEGLIAAHGDEGNRSEPAPQWINLASVLPCRSVREAGSWVTESSCRVGIVPGALIREIPVLSWILSE